MAQGTRGRWVRVATTGFAVLIGTGLVGCMNTDKDKKDKLVKQPTPGLHGTPNIGPNSGALGKGMPTSNKFGTGGIQQTGGFGQTRPGGAGDPMPLGYNSNDFNRNYPAQPGAPSTLGAPAQPGFVPSPLPGAGNFQPTGPIGFNNSNPAAPNNTVAGATPLSPSLTDIPIPQPPGAFGTQVAQNVQPIAPPTAPPHASYNVGTFGSNK